MSKSTSAPRVTGHIITHNHWDRDWVLTELITQKQAVGFFTNLWKMMEREPDYKMVLDGQAEVIDDYLDELPPSKRPAAERMLKKHISRGKLMAGPTYIQPDFVLISGETHVRNLLIGHNVAKKYGNVMKVGWLIDTFGHISQTPQLLNQFGIRNIFIARGFPIPPEEIMSEFTWSGPDGSNLLAVYTMNTSRNAMNLAQMPRIAENRIDIEIEKLTPLCIAPHIPLFNGFEQDQVIDDVLPFVRKISADKSKTYNLQQTNPDEYFDIIAPTLKGKKLPHCTGFLYSGIYMPLLHGTLSTRMSIKLRNDICEKLNEKWAEPLSALTWSRGDKYPAAELEKTWKMILQNDHHDDICGCCSDEVEIDMHKRYDKVERISRGIIDDKIRRVACNVDTRKAKDEGIALVAFNPTNIERRDIVRTVVELPAGTDSFALADERGRAVPFQISKRTARKVELAFQPALPPLGYSTVYLKPSKPASAPAGVKADAKKLTAENQYLRIKVNANGTLDVTHKQTGKTHREVGALVDGGDMGDLYDYSYPPVEKLVSSKNCHAKVSLIEAGPLVARFRVEFTMKIPAALHSNRKNRTSETVDMPVVSIVELAAGSKRVDWTTSFTNTARDHRLRVHFPTGVKSDTSHAGESFDVNPFTYLGELWGIELPERLRGLVVPGRDTVRITSYPFHGFCDYSDGKNGVGVVAKGIREYEITKPNREIALTLLRSVGCMTHLDILTRNGDVGWEIYTPTGQCFGTYTLRYGFCPHAGDWFASGLHTQSELFNEPVRVVQTTAHAGKMAPEFSFVRIEPAGKLVQSAIKRSEDGKALIVRCYNPRDTRVDGSIELAAKITSACKSNVAEDVTKDSLKKRGKAFVFSAGKREIITLRFELAVEHTLASKPAAALLKNTRECQQALPVREPSLDIPLPPYVFQEDIESEKRRLAKLRREYNELRAKRAAVKKKIDSLGREDDDLLIEWSKLGHLVALHRRYIDEAIFSILLTKRRWYEQTVKNPARRQRLMKKAMDGIAKTRLPELRIIGRLHEYVRQFYVSRKASRLGKRELLSDAVTDAAMSNTAQQSMVARNKRKA